MDAETFASKLKHAAQINTTQPWRESQEILDELRPHLNLASADQYAQFIYLDIRNQTLSGDLGGALDRIEPALARDMPVRRRLRLLRLGANIAVLARRFEETFSLLDRALALLADIEPDLPADEGVYSLASYVYTRVGEFERGAEYGQRAVRMAERVGGLRDQCVAYQRLGYAHKMAGRLEAARDAYRRSLAPCRESGDNLMTGVNESGYADLLRMLGEYDAAEELFDSGIERLERTDFESGQAEARLYRARLARERGDDESVEALLEPAIEQFAVEENWDYLAEAHALLGAIERRRGNLEAALEHYDERFRARERHMNMVRARQLAFHEVDFDLRSKDHQLALMNERARVSELEAEAQRQRMRLTIAGYVIVLVLLLTLGVLFLRVARERRRFRGLSRIDGLTGICNHTRFFELAYRALAESRDRDRTFTLVVSDIDYFKRINDRFGHMAGDQVLSVVGSRLSECFGDDAVVGRIGGEEFGIALPGATAADAEASIEELRKALTAIRAEDQPIPITMSFGIAESLDREEPLMRLRERADQALYRAKTGGRDRVVIADA